MQQTEKLEGWDCTKEKDDVHRKKFLLNDERNQEKSDAKKTSLCFFGQLTPYHMNRFNENIWHENSWKNLC